MAINEHHAPLSESTSSRQNVRFPTSPVARSPCAHKCARISLDISTPSASIATLRTYPLKVPISSSLDGSFYFLRPYIRITLTPPSEVHPPIHLVGVQDGPSQSPLFPVRLRREETKVIFWTAGTVCLGLLLLLWLVVLTRTSQ